MKKFRFTRTTFEVADAVMRILTDGMQLQLLRGQYPSMEWFSEKQTKDDSFVFTTSYGKLVCAAADNRLSEGGKLYDIRFKMERVASETVCYGLPDYRIDLWYRKNQGEEIFRESFDYNLWSQGQSPITKTDRQMADVPPPPISFNLDTLIRINRSIRPVYPEWTGRVVSPELESAGPAEYDLATVQQWLHDEQKNGGCMRAEVLYDHLRSNGLLDSCLGLADGIAIQEKGAAVFRQFFKRNFVYLWRSVIYDDRLFNNNRFNVPYLYAQGGKVWMGWAPFNAGDWDEHAIALRFAN